MPEAEQRRTDYGHYLKWIKIMLSALFPIIFGIFTIVFTMQQNSLAKMQRIEDQRRSNEMYHREIYSKFIEDVTNLLLSPSFSSNDRQHILHIEVRMLAALRNLDIDHKREIISFLYKLKLIITKDSIDESKDNDVRNYRLNMQEADLNSVKFVGSPVVPCDLENIYLEGIYAANSAFINCFMQKSSFIDSMLQQSSFANSLLFQTKFRHCYLDDANFSGASLLKTDFKGASLQRANFYQAELLMTDFTNADLLDARDLTDEKLRTLNAYLKPIILTNARFPNGTFGPINSSNLVTNGNAEEECMLYTNETETWSTDINYHMPILLFNWTRRANYSHNVNITNHCSFVLHSNQQEAFHVIDLSEFSLLISANRAYYKLSVYMGCTSRKDLIIISVRFVSEKGVHLQTQGLRFIEGGFDFAYRTGRIHLDATHIQIGINAEFHNTNNVNNDYCLIDNIQFNIFEQHNT